MTLRTLIARRRRPSLVARIEACTRRPPRFRRVATLAELVELERPRSTPIVVDELGHIRPFAGVDPLPPGGGAGKTTGGVPWVPSRPAGVVFSLGEERPIAVRVDRDGWCVECRALRRLVRVLKWSTVPQGVCAGCAHRDPGDESRAA